MRYLLSEAEKNQIRQKYLENVRAMNRYLPFGRRVSTSLSSLNKKLNDPNIQRLYKKSMEMNKERELRILLHGQLSAKYQYLKKPGHAYTLDRMVGYLLDLRPGAERYNEALVKSYYEHPEAFGQYYYTKAMNIIANDLPKIINSADKDNLLMDFYERNRTAIEYVFCISDATLGNEGLLNEDAQKYFPSIKVGYQIISDAARKVQYMSENSLTIPNLSQGQKNILYGSTFPDDYPDIHYGCTINDTNKLTLGMIDSTYNKLFKNMENEHFDISKPGAFSYFAAKDRNTKEYVSFVDALNDENKSKYEFERLNDETAKNIREFYNRDYITEENAKFPKPVMEERAKEFMNDFRYRYALNNNKHIAILEGQSLSDMINGVRRGMFEAIFRSTSEYTTRLKNAISEYEDLNSPNYQDKTKLCEAAKAYLNHRGITNRADALNQNSSAKNRALICLDIVAAIEGDKAKPIANINNEIKNDNNIIIKNDDAMSKFNNVLVDPDEILRESIDDKNLEEDVNENKIIIKEDDSIDLSIDIKIDDAGIDKN